MRKKEMKREANGFQKKMKRNQVGKASYGLPLKGLGGERENFFVWSKLKQPTTWVPQAWSKFAQSFKYIGIFIPRYTTIK